MKNYDDIIGLSRPVSKRRKMTNAERAAQFSPFAALTGFDDDIREADRETQAFVGRGEDVGRELDLALARWREDGESRKGVTVIFFLPDRKKEGGSYRTYCGDLKRADEVQRLLIFADGTRIPFDDVVGVR